LQASTSGPSCRLRNQTVAKPEVTAKCVNVDMAPICVDAYKSLSKGQEAIDLGSTDTFPWLIDSATQFENLQELDNAIMVYVKGISFASGLGLTDRGYEFFRYARSVFEDGLNRSDSSLKNPATRQMLVRAGQALIESARKKTEHAPVTDMQVELKASLLSGISLRKADKEESKDVIVVDGRQLYAKKAQEYLEQLYKARHNDTLDGLDQVLAKAKSELGIS